MINRFADESGFGLPVTIGVLLVVILIGTWTVSNADELHRASEHDRGSARALGPADAALDRASWRLAQQPVVAAGECLSSTAAGEVQAPDAACPAPVATSMGNGATYNYVVSAEHASASTCAGLATVIGDRCVTATGTANGVSRRVQAILRKPTVALTYAFTGMVGEDWVRFGNGVEAYVCAGDTPGRIGSNSEIAFGGHNLLNASGCGGSGAWGIAHPGTAVVSGDAAPWPSNTNPPTTHALPDVDPLETATVNDNASLVGRSGFTFVGGAGTRNLSITGDATLPPGTYNFCNLVLDGANLDVTAAPGATVYVDSPDRAGSGCAAGTGGFWIKNGEQANFSTGSEVTAAALGARTRWLRVVVYGSTAWESGTRPCNGNKAGAVLLCNQAKFNGTIYAPNSKVVLSNGAYLVGAVASQRLDMENTVRFRMPAGLDSGAIGETLAAAAPAHWTECSSRATGTDC